MVLARLMIVSGPLYYADDAVENMSQNGVTKTIVT
jgi:hypothetical protein